MTDRQSNKQNMATTTKEVLDTNLSLFELIVAFFSQYGLLGNSLITINTLNTVQGTDITGYAEEKANLKEGMADKTIVVAGPLTAFARINKNVPLLNKVDVTHTEIIQAKDEDAPDIAKVILSEGNDLDPAELTEIGLIPANLTALNDSIVAFEAATPRPRAALTIAERATSDLEEEFEELDEILETIDELIEPFKATENKFYKEYKVARKIVDAGSRHISLIIKCTDSISDAVVVGAEVSIVELAEVLTTTRTGNARFFSLLPGSVTVTIEAEFYEPVILENVGIFDGKTTRFDLEMVKT